MVDKRQATIAVAATMALCALAACGNPVGAGEGAETSESEKTFTRFDEMDADERMDALVAAAEEEGEVVAYLRADVVAPELEKAFEDTYDVDLQILNPGTSVAVRQQVVEQSRAGRLEADIIEAYMHELNLIFTEENIVAKTPQFLADAALDPEMVADHAVEVYSYAFGPAWNTDEITGDEVPTSYEDLTGEVWKDNLVMVSEYEIAYKAVFDSLTADGMSPEEFEEIFTSIGANTSVTDAGSPAVAFMAAGQYLGGPLIGITSVQKAGNVPVTFDPAVGPFASTPIGISLTRESPHPAAAMLFSHWYLTEGSSIIQKEMYIEQSPEETDLQGAEIARPDNEDLTLEQLEAWRQAHENMVRGREGVLPEYVMSES
jgi:iron(III) transport system substrate-binding protein